MEGMRKNTEMPMSGPLPAKFINGSIPLRHTGFRNRCAGPIIFTLNHGKEREREAERNIDFWLKSFSPLWSCLLNNLL